MPMASYSSLLSHLVRASRSSESLAVSQLMQYTAGHVANVPRLEPPLEGSLRSERPQRLDPSQGFFAGPQRTNEDTPSRRRPLPAMQN